MKKKKISHKWSGSKIKELRESIGCTQEEFKILIKCQTRHYVSELEKKGVMDGTQKAEILDTIQACLNRIKKEYEKSREIKPISCYLNPTSFL